MSIAERRAGYGAKGKVHKLRHTFCTRVAMAGQAPRTIQALAGHVSSETTLRYMHVVESAPARAARAIRGTRRAPAGCGHGNGNDDSGLRSAQGEIRTRTPYGATPSRWCVYQFHHLGIAGGFLAKGTPPAQGTTASALAKPGACVTHAA
jgi:hypothetical protein